MTITSQFLLEERVTKSISDWLIVRACYRVVVKIVAICGVVSHLSLLSKHVEVADRFGGSLERGRGKEGCLK